MLMLPGAFLCSVDRSINQNNPALNLSCLYIFQGISLKNPAKLTVAALYCCTKIIKLIKMTNCLL
jgi:hypothetical protein